MPPQQFCAGQTYLFPIPGHPGSAEKSHLWIVVTDPDDDDEFVVVNLTSLRGAKDQTVILQKGEHSFVAHPTCVHFAMAEITSVVKIQAYLDRGRARMQDPIEPGILKLIYDGFLASDRTKRRIADYIKERRSS